MIQICQATVPRITVKQICRKDANTRRITVSTANPV